MIVFIQDAEAQKPKFQKKIDKISLMASDYGLSQQTHKTTVTHNPQFIAEDCIKNNKNDIEIFAVIGTDASFLQVACALLKLRSRAAIAYIPLSERTYVGKKLGVKNIDQACKAISKKRIQQNRVVTINEKPCFFACETPTKKSPMGKELIGKKMFEIKARYHDSFYIHTKTNHLYTEVNPPQLASPHFVFLHHPKNQELKNKTEFSAQFAMIEFLHGRGSVKIDNQKILEVEKMIIETKPYLLQVIVGQF